MDISKMKSLTAGMKKIQSDAKGEVNVAQYDEEYQNYLNEGIDALNNNNTEVGIRLLKKAAEKIPVACLILAIYYADQHDNANFFKWTQKGAEAGDAKCMFFMADYYVDTDEYESIEWIKRAAEAGLIEAMNGLVNLYLSRQEYSMAFKWAKKAANTTPNDENCLDKYEVTKEAALNLGICYLNGIGTPQNPAEAFALLKKSANAGNAKAMFLIGQMYRNGVGVIEDKKVAEQWLKKSSDAGDLEGMVAYGNVLEELSEQIEGNINKNPDSFFGKLGNVLSAGGTLYVQNQITELYEKAAKGGNMEGYFYLALFLFKRANSEKLSLQPHQDRLNAIKYATKGIEGGNADCMWMLGNIWENIYTVMDSENEKQYQKELQDVPGEDNQLRAANLALHWYEQAANAGVEQAKQAYDEFFNKVSGKGSSSGNGGGCFITTAVCDSFGKADDCYELTAFRNFRDNWLSLQADGKNLIAEYYSIAPKIVSKIGTLADSAEIYKNIWKKYLAPCLAFIESGDNQSCKRLYTEMVNSLKKKFL